jgi:hypothetical protein
MLYLWIIIILIYDWELFKELIREPMVLKGFILPAIVVTPWQQTFILKGYPGETVSFPDRRNRFYHGRIEEVIASSPFRTALCMHYESCGGCSCNISNIRISWNSNTAYCVMPLKIRYATPVL